MSVMIIARMISVFAIRPKRYNNVVAKYRHYPVFSRVDQRAPRLEEVVVVKVIVFENIQNDIETTNYSSVSNGNVISSIHNHIMIHDPSSQSLSQLSKVSSFKMIMIFSSQDVL